MSLILDLAKHILSNGDVAFYSYYLANVRKIVDNYLEMDNKINELMIHKLKPEAEQEVANFVSDTICVLCTMISTYKDKYMGIKIKDESYICSEINKIKLFTTQLKLKMVYENLQLKGEFILLKQYIVKNSNMVVSFNATVKSGGDFSWYMDKIKGLFQLPSTQNSKKTTLQIKN